MHRNRLSPACPDQSAMAGAPRYAGRRLEVARGRVFAGQLRFVSPSGVRAFATRPTEGPGSNGIPQKKTEACAPVHVRRDYCWLFLRRQGAWPASHIALKLWDIIVPDCFPVLVRPDSAARDVLASIYVAIRIDASSSSIRTGASIHPIEIMSTLSLLA